MPEPIRRVVTGHDAAGKSVFVMDGAAPHVYQRAPGSEPATLAFVLVDAKPV